MILFILIASVCFSILNAQDILFEENFEAASGAENILDNYLGWESGEFDNTTNNNYFWVFDNTRTTVISGSYSMAVSENNPVNSSTTEYKDNQAASTLVYHTTPIDASNYIRTIESRQGLKVACLEVIACKMGYISKQQLLKLAEPLKKNGYGQYLIARAKEI